MARKTIKPINLERTLKEILTKYGDDVYEVLSAAVAEISNEATKKLRAGGPYGGTGAYKNDWAADDIPKGVLSKTRVVYNTEHYRLTHLLEKGHVSRNGTRRTFGTVRAYPHIKPVEDWTIKELPQKVEEAIKHIS